MKTDKKIVPEQCTKSTIETHTDNKNSPQNLHTTMASLIQCNIIEERNLHSSIGLISVPLLYAFCQVDKVVSQVGKAIFGCQ